MGKKNEFFEKSGFWQWIEEQLTKGENYTEGYNKAIDDLIELLKKDPYETRIEYAVDEYRYAKIKELEQLKEVKDD